MNLRKIGNIKDFNVRFKGSIPFSEIHYDFIPLNSFTQLTETEDFTTSDFVIFHGPIARSGPYKYEKDGQEITLYKKIENLEDMYSRYEYLPLRVSDKPGAHHAEELGFAMNFTVNHDTDEIEADLVLIDEARFRPILAKKNEYHVSPGYHDHIEGDTQIIIDLDHVALSLGDERARACTGQNEKGASCTIVKKIHDQNLINNEVVN